MYLSSEWIYITEWLWVFNNCLYFLIFVILNKSFKVDMWREESDKIWENQKKKQKLKHLDISRIRYSLEGLSHIITY
jgi:hypothetical protein